MARDYVTVANLATGFFGEDDQIRARDEDSKPARTIAAVWDEIRKFVLSQGQWDFATKRFALTARPATADAPIIGYTNAFPLPPDFRRLTEILSPCEIVDDYSLEGGEILADTLGPVVIRYVRDVEDPALWSDGFTEAFAMRLAWQIADRLSGDKQRKEQAQGAFERAMRRAKGVDAKQNPPRAFVAGDWSRARRAGVSRAPNT